MDAQDWDQRYAASELVWSRGPNQLVAEELAEIDRHATDGDVDLWRAQTTL